jgi:hypothetical protein
MLELAGMNWTLIRAAQTTCYPWAFWIRFLALSEYPHTSVIVLESLGQLKGTIYGS